MNKMYLADLIITKIGIDEYHKSSYPSYEEYMNLSKDIRDKMLLTCLGDSIDIKSIKETISKIVLSFVDTRLNCSRNTKFSVFFNSVEDFKDSENSRLSVFIRLTSFERESKNDKESDKL